MASGFSLSWFRKNLARFLFNGKICGILLWNSLPNCHKNEESYCNLKQMVCIGTQICSLALKLLIRSKFSIALKQSTKQRQSYGCFGIQDPSFCLCDRPCVGTLLCLIARFCCLCEASYRLNYTPPYIFSVSVCFKGGSRLWSLGVRTNRACHYQARNQEGAGGCKAP